MTGFTLLWMAVAIGAVSAFWVALLVLACSAIGRFTEDAIDHWRGE